MAWESAQKEAKAALARATEAKSARDEALAKAELEEKHALEVIQAQADAPAAVAAPTASA